jgi:2-methylcitrate dehydratase PrpD
MTATGPTSVGDWEASIFGVLETPVPNPVLDRGAKTVADVLTAMVAGSAAEPYAQVWDEVDAPPGTATVIGTNRQTAPIQAAMLNGTAAIVQEIEEGHNTGGHVGAGIVAGGLAMAEYVDTDGETLVESCVRTYEICARLERAIFTMKARINDAVPWLVRDPHSTWTTVGPAVAAVLCTDPEPSTIRQTFRLAANRAVVSMDDPYDTGPPSRNVTAGASAGVGVAMAQLALAGMPGSGAVMQTVYDPFETILPNGFDSLFADLGEHWAITENYFKPHPSCRYTHAPLDALRDLDRAVAPDEVDRILVETYANAADMAHASPETLTGAKFSIPYVLARHLHSGEVALEHFSPEALADESVQELADRVDVRAVDEFEDAFPENWGARVSVELRDGGTVRAERAYPRGDYRDPLSEDEFDERLESLLAYGLSDVSRESAFETVRSPRQQSVRAIGASLRADE